MIARLRALPATGQLAVAVAAAAVVGALVVVLPVLADAALLLACASVVGTFAVLAQWLWQHQHATDWSTDFVDRAPARGSDPRISRLAERVDAALAGDAVAQTQLHESIRALADDRLRRRHGRGLADVDAEEARRVLGPELTAYLDHPPTTRLTAARVEQFVTTLEELT